MAILIAGLGLTDANAGTLPKPTASYDGVASLNSGGSQLTATVNAAGPKQRWSIDVQGMPQTILANSETGAVYLLIPALNTAMAIDTRGATGVNLSQLSSLPVTPEGHETIAGLDTIRYAVRADSKQGSFTGHVWEASGGILMRIEGSTMKDGKASPVSAVMTEVHVRPQNPALLTLPPNIRTMPMSLNGMPKDMAIPTVP